MRFTLHNPLMKRVHIESRTAGQTRRVGRLLGRHLDPGSLIALSGDLGTGKTEFIKGLAKGLGVQKGCHVSSPSFVLINEYPGRLPLYHIDLYRLSGGTDVEDMGLEEYIYGQGVTAIEWAEKAASLIPSRRFWIDIRWTGSTRRRLTIKAFGKRNEQVLETFRAELEAFLS